MGMAGAEADKVERIKIIGRRKNRKQTEATPRGHVTPHAVRTRHMVEPTAAVLEFKSRYKTTESRANDYNLYSRRWSCKTHSKLLHIILPYIMHPQFFRALFSKLFLFHYASTILQSIISKHYFKTNAIVIYFELFKLFNNIKILFK